MNSLLNNYRLAVLTSIFVLLSARNGLALGWPPILDNDNPTTRTPDGRTIDRYVHGRLEAWGYPVGSNTDWQCPIEQETALTGQNRNSFYVVSPKTARANAPLFVVLHSANRTGYDYLGWAYLDRKVDPHDDPATTMTEPQDDSYALFLSSMNSEWWGAFEAKTNSAFHRNEATSAELRVLDTVKWVADRYHVDRNRIYLCGVSMGGCGALAIGMLHGDVFAAVEVTVPAGTEYVASRMGGLAPVPAAVAPQIERDAWLKRAAAYGLPDPPVVLDFSSQSDGWSATEPVLVEAAQEGRLPLVLGWGPFGHAAFGRDIGKYPLCHVAMAYPWLEIRKNEAYPVFTHASCDQQSPWLNAPAHYDDAGQMNAYFRWKNQRDTSSGFTMDLWIAHPQVPNPPPAMPASSTADVTLRRLQKFKIHKGHKYFWRESRSGSTVASGEATADALNLLTLPHVTLTTEPAELSIERGARH